MHGKMFVPEILTYGNNHFNLTIDECHYIVISLLKVKEKSVYSEILKAPFNEWLVPSIVM